VGQVGGAQLLAGWLACMQQRVSYALTLFFAGPGKVVSVGGALSSLSRQTSVVSVSPHRLSRLSSLLGVSLEDLGLLL
jgi:hypothetical protein